MLACVGLFSISILRKHLPMLKPKVAYISKSGKYLRYSSRLSLHSRVPLTRVFINFIQGMSLSSHVTSRESYFVRCSRVILQVLHASLTWRAARESDFACCMRVRPLVLHAIQTLCAARKSLYVAILCTYHSKLKTKHTNESIVK